MVDVPSQSIAASLSSDDEAPEEIPLSVSKAQAAAARNWRSSGRPQHRQTQSDKTINRGGTAGQSTSLESRQPPEPAAEPAEEDALPEDVIAALTASHEPASLPQGTPAAAALLEPAQQHQVRRQRRPLVQRKAGPVTVQMLDLSRSELPSESAMQFVQKRLNTDKKRSFEMLQPCQRWSGRHSKTVRHCNGPALQFVKSKS